MSHILSKNQNDINIYKCSKQDKLCCKYGHRIIPIQDQDCGGIFDT